MKTNLMLAGGFALAMFAGNAQAAPLPEDLLPDNDDLAIYLKVLPDYEETKIFMNADLTANQLWGSIGSNDNTQDILFSSTDLITAKNGFASISGNFDDLTITTPNYEFGDITFGTQGSASFWITAYSYGVEIGKYLFEDLKDDAVNNILVLATTSNLLMTSVVLSVVGGDDLTDVKLVELSDVGPRDSVTEVPLPAALPLLAAALAGVGFMGRRRRQTALS